MHNHNDPIYRTCSIIGIDLFSPEYPDLRLFKYMLLTGKENHTETEFRLRQIQQTLQEIDIDHPKRKDNNFLDERILSLVLRRAFRDAGLGSARTGQRDISIVIHAAFSYYDGSDTGERDMADSIPKQIDQFNRTAVSLKKIVTTSESFEDAVKKSISLLQDASCSHVALCSLFPYKNPNSSASEQDAAFSNQASHPDASWGAGCLVLSNPEDADNAYADLTWGISHISQLYRQTQSVQSMVAVNQPPKEPAPHLSRYSIDVHQNNTYAAAGIPVEFENWIEEPDVHLRNKRHPFFEHSSIIRMIRSSLSLNSQTYFPDDFSGEKSEVNLADESQAFIRPWFMQPYLEKRESEILLQKNKDQVSLVWLQKGYSDRYRPNQSVSNFGLSLLPIDVDDPGQIDKKLTDLGNRIKDCEDLISFCNDNLAHFTVESSGAHALVILGTGRQEILNELEHARVGVAKALKDGKDWQTPTGSYFTPDPFGPQEKIAFVYPGAFGTYVGMGREIFYLFPQLHAALQELTDDPGNAINETVIFPQTLTPEKKDRMQSDLNNNPTQMISSGICFSYLYTAILRDIFKIRPHAAFGYSLGEISMMFAMGVWTQADAMRTSLEVSSVFHERVTGSQNAIREYWNLPPDNNENDDLPLWVNFVLLAPVEKVEEAARHEDRVYITHINTQRQVVIGGDRNACLRVVSALKCMYLEAPYRHAIHCPPIAAEFNDFLRLHDWPVEKQPDIPVYTAANYAALQYDTKIIAESFANMLTHPVDFPRLVNLAYQDGARIFIELGAGNNCSKWVESVLKGKPHVALSINANNVSDHVSILSLLARLISHRVPMELDALVR